jgi:hypothetical protein
VPAFVTGSVGAAQSVEHARRFSAKRGGPVGPSDERGRLCGTNGQGGSGDPSREVGASIRLPPSSGRRRQPGRLRAPAVTRTVPAERQRPWAPARVVVPRTPLAWPERSYAAQAARMVMVDVVATSWNRPTETERRRWCWRLGMLARSVVSRGPLVRATRTGGGALPDGAVSGGGASMSNGVGRPSSWW